VVTKVKQSGIADDAVGAAQIAAGAVGTSEIADGAVTAADLAAVLDLSGKTLTLPPANTPALTKGYLSAEQTITSAGLIILPHGLGVKPKLMQLSLVCKTAEAGYLVGEEVVVSVNQTATAADRHTSIRIDATNITIRFSSTATAFYVANATTGAGAALTNANWRLVVSAYG
jgi:hypothetical protein